MIYLILDWSVLMHKNWHKMFNCNYVAKTKHDSVLQEFAYNLCLETLELVERFKPAYTFLALDSAKNWRSKVYEDYYKTHIDYYKIGAQEWIVVRDKNYYRCHYNPEADQWFCNKLKGKEIKEIKSGLSSPGVTPYIKGMTPSYMIDKNSNCHKDITGEKDYNILKSLIFPQYKGNRKDQWKSDISRDDFKKAGNKLARIIGAYVDECKVFQLSMAEADDIIYSLAQAIPKEAEIIVVSVDADLHQLSIDRKIIYWNPVKDKLYTKTAGTAKYELIYKLLGGDTSDNIPGMCFKGRSNLFAPVVKNEEDVIIKGKTTVKWINNLADPLHAANKNPWPVVLSEMKELQDEDSYTRNLQLIYMKCIPATIVAYVAKMFKEPKPLLIKYPLDKLGIQQKDLDAIRLAAPTARNLDRATGLIK